MKEQFKLQSVLFKLCISNNLTCLNTINDIIINGIKN